MRRCVYTVLTGDDQGYQLREDAQENPGWDYIAFTTRRDITSDVWQVEYIDERNFLFFTDRNELAQLDPRKISRFIKINYNNFLGDYDMSIYLDASFGIPMGLDDFVRHKCIEDLTVMRHPKRDCVYAEFDAIRDAGKEKKKILNTWAGSYLDEGMPRHSGLLAPGMMFRRHTKEVSAFCSRWFREVYKHSYRDIPSLSYCMWKQPIPYTALDFKKTCYYFGRGRELK